MTLLDDVMAEHYGNVGWREGPGNQNPWGPEQGIANAAYCDSGCSMVPYHHGVRWWVDCQFHEKGCAYTPFHVQAAGRHGKYVADHASKGAPAPLAVGQPVFFDWNNTGTVDHVETVAELPQGPNGSQYVTIGYNTGNPGGCYRVLRDRRYLHGTIVMDWAYAAAPVTPPVQPVQPPQPPPVQPHPAPAVPDRLGNFPLPQGQWFGPYDAREVRNHSGRTNPSDRAAVNRILDQLRARGWKGVPSNVTEYTSAVASLVRQYQEDKHLAVDGECGAVTWNNMRTSPVT